MASWKASALRVPDPEKPVAAWRETIYVSRPIVVTPEFDAHPTKHAESKAVYRVDFISGGCIRVESLTFKVRGWLEAGEARCKPVPLHRNVRGYFETPTKLPARTKMLGLRREISCHSRVLG